MLNIKGAATEIKGAATSKLSLNSLVTQYQRCHHRDHRSRLLLNVSCVSRIDWIKAPKVQNPPHTGLAHSLDLCFVYKPCTGNQTSLGKIKLVGKTRPVQPRLPTGGSLIHKGNASAVESALSNCSNFYSLFSLRRVDKLDSWTCFESFRIFWRIMQSANVLNEIGALEKIIQFN